MMFYSLAFKLAYSLNFLENGRLGSHSCNAKLADKSQIPNFRTVQARA